MKRFVLSLIAFCAISALTLVQAQTTYTGTLTVTSSDGVAATINNSEVTVEDNGTTATMTMSDLSIGSYTLSTVTATLTKTSDGTVTGCTKINVTGSLLSVTPSSASGIITSSSCNVDIDMKALFGLVTVSVSFQSN